MDYFIHIYMVYLAIFSNFILFTIYSLRYIRMRLCDLFPAAGYLTFGICFGVAFFLHSLSVRLYCFFFAFSLSLFCSYICKWLYTKCIFHLHDYHCHFILVGVYLTIDFVAVNLFIVFLDIIFCRFIFVYIYY